MLFSLPGDQSHLINIYPNVLRHCPVYNSMRVINHFHHASVMFPPMILLLVTSYTPRQERQKLEWGLICLAAPYFLLLMILKSRAAYHRKQQGSRRDVENDGISWMHWGTVLFLEAKVSPIFDPILSDIWGLLCHIAVLILFPLRITLIYLLISLMYPVMYEMITLCYGTRSVNVEKLVYNGRRYTCVERGYRCAKVQDGKQNILYFSMMDLHGLIPSDNKQ